MSRALALALALAMTVGTGCGATPGPQLDRSAVVDVRQPVHHALDGWRAEDCQKCHPAITEEWRSSRHAGSWSDPLVRAEYAAAPSPSCVGCHAPLAPSTHVPPAGVAARDGVDCMTCHELRGARMAAADPGGGSCGGCHQFRFSTPDDDDAIPYDAGAWLQDTVGEWSRSDAARAGVGCRDCHMPAVRGADGTRHFSHRFAGMLDRELVARAVVVEVSARRRGGLVHVTARLHPGEIGHAFPTGDMFREAVLRVWTEEREPGRGERRLRRWFDNVQRPGPDGSLRTVHAQVGDTRVPPPGAGPPREFDLVLRSPAGRTVGWSLDLLARPADALPEGGWRTHVADGRVAIAASTPDR